MPNFLAKLIAGGLSAAVILVWWPAFFPADTVASWLARGVAWTLAFELFTIVFTPLEHALWDTAPARRLRDKAARPGAGLPLGRSATLACSALLVVGFLLSFAPEQPRKRPVATTTHVTEVHRVVRVVRKPVEVTRVVSTGSAYVRPAPARATGSVQPAPADHPAARPTSKPRPQPEQPTRTQPAAPAPQATTPEMDAQSTPAVAPRQQLFPRVVTPS
ncbi:MAG: hypothetical protein QOJ57_2568 [Thermoleophilaceae bacterium]|nr:hypothetical protein [Thermoleophilaceae bacterium]